MSPAFRSVILDVDSTLAQLEGVDWLAAQRGPDVGSAVEQLTRRAMEGIVPLERVYAERLGLIRPTKAEIDLLAKVYVDALAPGAAGCVARLRASGVRVVLVSGGLRDALLHLAHVLGVQPTDVHAVRVTYDASDAVEGLDGVQPLTTALGKRDVVQALSLPEPVLAVGDGMTDAAIRPVVAAFAAFTAFERRPAVVASADHEVVSFAALERLVFP